VIRANGVATDLKRDQNLLPQLFLTSLDTLWPNGGRGVRLIALCEGAHRAGVARK